MGCKSLIMADIESEHIKEIGNEAFFDCALETVNIGKGVSVIGSEAFGVSGTRSLKWIYVNDLNEHFASSDGVLYKLSSSKEYYELMLYPHLKTISDDLKKKCTAFVVPTSVKGKPVLGIGENAFKYSESLLNLDIHDNIEYVDYGAFSFNHIRELSIGKNTEYIGISKDEINTNNETREHTVFENALYLEKVTVSADNIAYSSISGVLFDKALQRVICYPANKAGATYTLPETVSVINRDAFANNRNLNNVYINSYIESVGTDAFEQSALSYILFRETYAPKTVSNGAFSVKNSERFVIYYSEGYHDSVDGNIGWKEYESKYNIKEYRVRPTKQDNGLHGRYYAVVVVDKTGLPVDGIYVSLTDPNGVCETVDSQEGIVVFTDMYSEKGDGAFALAYGYENPYKLTLTDPLGDYYTFENPEFYLDAATNITYVTLSTVPVVSGVSVEYELDTEEVMRENGGVVSQAMAGVVQAIGGLIDPENGDRSHYNYDINSQSAKVNRWMVDSIDINIRADFDNDMNITGYYLLQNDTILKVFNTEKDLSPERITVGTVNGKKYATVTMSIVTSLLKNDTPIFVAVEFSNGDTITQKLNIDIFEMKLYNMNLFYATSGIKLTVDERIPFLGGAELEITYPEKYKPKINFGIGADYFRVIFGEFGDELEFGDNYDENNSETLKDAVKNWKTFASNMKNGTFEDSHTNKLGLKLSGYLEYKYKGNDDFDFTSYISGVLEYEYGDGITQMVMMIPVRLEYKLTVSGEITYKLVFDKDNDSYQLDPEFQTTIKGAVDAWAGIGCKLVSVGVYGNLTMAIVLDIYETFEVNKWSLSGDLGAYFKYDGLFVKFYKKWSLLDRLGVSKEWVIYDKGYGWLPPEGYNTTYNLKELYDQDNYVVAPSLLASPQNNSSLFADAYSSIDPQSVRVGDTIYIMYADDLYGYWDYNEYNYQKLVYRTYNVNTGELSEQRILDDNGFADGDFKLYSDGINVYVAFTQLNRRLRSNDAENISGYLGSLEVKAAVLGSDGNFAVSNYLSSNAYYDMKPVIGTYNGKISAFWIQNTDNDMTGISVNGNSIYKSDYSHGSWSSPVLVKDGINTVTDFEAANEKIAYITDSNNDLMTISNSDGTKDGYSDKKLTVINLETLETVESSDNAYFDVSFDGKTLVYYQNGNIADADSNSWWFDEAIPELPEEYQIVRDENGAVRAVVFVGSCSNEQNELIGNSNLFAIFCNDGKFGKPVRLTDFGESEYITSFTAEALEDQLFVSYLLSTVDQEDASYRFCVEKIDYPSAVEIGDISFDYSCILPYADVSLSVEIKNNGAYTLTSVPVTVYNNDKTRVLFNGTVDFEGIRSGTSSIITLPSFNIGELEVNEYLISINGEERHIKLVYSDYAVYGKHVVLGNANYIVGSVFNKGFITDENCELQLTYNGQKLGTPIKIELLAQGERQYFTIPVDLRLEDFDTALFKLEIIGTDDYITADNIAEITVSSSQNGADINSSSAWISDNMLIFDKKSTEDVSIYFDAEKSAASVVGLFIDKDYKIVDNSIVFLNSYLKTLSFGTHEFTLSFGNGTNEKTAKFIIEITESYNVKWSVDGTVYESSVLYGELPEFSGDTHKSSDNGIKYTFIGWDKEIIAATGDCEYKACYAEENVGTVELDVSEFSVAAGQEFYIEINVSKLSDTNSTLKLNIDSSVAELLYCDAAEGINVSASENAIMLDFNSSVESGSIIKLGLKASDSLSAGQYSFISVISDDIVNITKTQLTIYEQGDIDMNGTVDQQDVALLRNYITGKSELSDIQLCYANVYSDYDEYGFAKINTRDISAIQKLIAS